jgi:RHS repeat-associated protein
MMVVELGTGTMVQQNRLTAASNAGTCVAATYARACPVLRHGNGTGRRVSKTVNGTTTRYMYDGDRMIGELNASNAWLRAYAHGPGVDEPIASYAGTTSAARSMLYRDHQGSIVAEADSAGNATQIYSYSPYGEPDRLTGTPLRYTGQFLDAETGLMYYKARMYWAGGGRFLQSDPIGYEPDMDLYTYVGDDPVNKTDSTGLCTGSRICREEQKAEKAEKAEKELKAARKEGVAKAWQQERAMVEKTGKGTVDWSATQKAELLKEGKVKGFEGHHKNTVKGNPLEMARNPNNVSFMTRPQHMELHSRLGGTRVAVTGEPLMTRSFGIFGLFTDFTGILSGRIRTDNLFNMSHDMGLIDLENQHTRSILGLEQGT